MFVWNIYLQDIYSFFNHFKISLKLVIYVLFPDYKQNKTKTEFILISNLFSLKIFEEKNSFFIHNYYLLWRAGTFINLFDFWNAFDHPKKFANPVNSKKVYFGTLLTPKKFFFRTLIIKTLFSHHLFPLLSQFKIADWSNKVQVNTFEIHFFCLEFIIPKYIYTYIKISYIKFEQKTKISGFWKIDRKKMNSTDDDYSPSMPIANYAIGVILIIISKFIKYLDNLYQNIMLSLNPWIFRSFLYFINWSNIILVLLFDKIISSHQ